MHTADTSAALARVFSELVDGTSPHTGFVLNRGDIGLLGSLAKLSAVEASRAVDGGATIAAHVLHLGYGLSLMNRWASEGGDPFADAKWDEAWKTSIVDERDWSAIRERLRDEAHRWLQTLGSSRRVTDLEYSGLVSSIAHFAYHLGAIRQIAKDTRGPREGTF